MEWQDEGIVLSSRRHGESAAIVSLLTRGHGRHAGLVRGGMGRRLRGIYQNGNLVSAAWRARLEEHLGSFVCELVTNHAAHLLDEPARLAGLSSACALMETALPEREPHEDIFEDFLTLLSGREGEGWAETYVRWEMSLLANLGFGLDLSQCAATGVTQDLAFVSPKSGRAVSAAAGVSYRDKLLTLPEFLTGSETHSDSGPPSFRDVEQGLALTGFFLRRHVFAPHHRDEPPARIRFIDRLRGMSALSGMSRDLEGMGEK
ncbi:MAG: DNA repair protein RecO [Alphaproteobacteria bacterium]|nr:DNA repair protein RecO [Alphaproteobacteria bacterium]